MLLLRHYKSVVLVGRMLAAITYLLNLFSLYVALWLYIYGKLDIKPILLFGLLTLLLGFVVAERSSQVRELDGAEALTVAKLLKRIEHAEFEGIFAKLNKLDEEEDEDAEKEDSPDLS